MNKQFLRFVQVSFIGLDMLFLNIVFFSSLFISDHRFEPISFESFPFHYFRYLSIINGFWLIMSWLAGQYSTKYILSFENFSKRTFKAYILWFICVILYLFFTKEDFLSKPFIVSTILGFALLLVVARFLHVGFLYFRGNKLLKRILIIGYNNTSKKLATYLEQDGYNTEILGFTESEQNVKELSHYPIISDIDLSVEVAKQHNVDEIFSTITPEQDHRLYDLMTQADHECIRFRIVPDFSVFIKGPFYVSYFKDMPILMLRNESIDDFNNSTKKRIFDIIVSSLVIVFILSWLIPLVSLLILLESPGPIFFSQLRTGKNKKSFPCYKFRSMYVNKESDSKQATKNDKRITKIGKLLRRTSIDEFPQFINVLIGNMSIVGPRPHMVKHTDEYSKIVESYMVRHFSKPGITGWAQINGYRGEISETSQISNRIQYDIWYLENWSLLLDVKILFLTVFNILKGEEKAF